MMRVSNPTIIEHRKEKNQFLNVLDFILSKVLPEQLDNHLSGSLLIATFLNVMF